MGASAKLLLGVVSDTHDRFDPALRTLFAGVDFILHAGDITGPDVLQTLEQLAPVRAVRGNNDGGAWSAALPAARVERFLEVPVLVVHILGSVAEPTLSVQFLLQAEQPRVVVSGHSHQGLLAVKDRCLFFNPGSAGPARFKLKPGAGLLTVEPGRVHGALFALEDGAPRKLSELELAL